MLFYMILLWMWAQCTENEEPRILRWMQTKGSPRREERNTSPRTLDILKFMQSIEGPQQEEPRMLCTIPMFLRPMQGKKELQREEAKIIYTKDPCSQSKCLQLDPQVTPWRDSSTKLPLKQNPIQASQKLQTAYIRIWKHKSKQTWQF